MHTFYYIYKHTHQYYYRNIDLVPMVDYFVRTAHDGLVIRSDKG